MHREKIFKKIEVSWGFSCDVRDWFPTISDMIQPVRKLLSPNYLAVVPGACWLSLGETGRNEGATMKTSY